MKSSNLPFRTLILALALLNGLGAQTTTQPPDAPAYRRHALSRQGDAERGRKLFNDPKLGCSACHSTDGSASKAGPDLFAAGDAFGRRDLVDAILKPSATIAPGYGTIIVEKKDGTMYQGVLKGSNPEAISLMGPDGNLLSIPAAEVKSQSGSPISLMPEGLQASATLPEFTDLIEYLTSLKQPDSSLASDHGMPTEIPPLAKQAVVKPFLAGEFTLPRTTAESGLSSLREIPGSNGTFLVLHQRGMIWKVVKEETEEKRSVFADLTTEVFSDRGPNGLLDIAFHPKFRSNRRYYLFYQIFAEGKVVSQIVEKEFDGKFTGDSGKAGRVILRISSVAEDHSGGCLVFGPDGFLYVAMGDTGPHNDPNGHAQNPGLLLGKLMRIDVDRQDPGLAYAIPKDNPFIERPGTRPEIWATGFRNPWRFSFDRKSGDLWLADVGQDRVEEIDIVERGQNHGWNVYEAYEPFSNQFRKDSEVFTKPVFAYRRKYGNSITGGHVYRGPANPSFQGVYLCADYTSKRLFGIKLEEGVLSKVRQIGSVPQRVVSFCEDEKGNLYAVGYEGSVYAIDLTDAVFE